MSSLHEYINISSGQIHLDRPQSIDLEYYSYGEGDKDILYLRGSGSISMYSTPYLIKALSKDFRIHSFTYPGFSNSGSLRNWTLENFSILINEFLKKLNKNKVIILGNSIGSGIAFYYAFKNPQKIQKLAVISPLTSNFKHNWLKGLYYSIYENRKERKILEKKGTNPLPPNFTKMRSIVYLKPLFKLYRFTKSINLKKELKDLHVPCKAFIGKKDSLINVEKEIDQMKESGIELHIYPNEGHYIVHNQVEDIKKALLEN